jgi:hypothetical protein
MPGLSDFCDSDPGVDAGGGHPTADYLETISLLQEEVVRLEQELRWHHQGQSDETSSATASALGEVGPAAAGESQPEGAEELERLRSEVASREETIRLLLDQLSQVEEAQAASRAEWEHLAGWVSELEQRVEGRDGDAVSQLQTGLAAQQQQADELRWKAEQDRRVWELQRRAYEEEIARLQATLAQVPTASQPGLDADGRAAPDEPDAGLVETLQAENRRLRAAWRELMQKTAAAERSEALDAKLTETLKERDELRRQLEQIQDARRRERLEHEAAVAELQARLSHAALARPEELPPDQRVEGLPRELDVDLRIRALRQHLVEMDQNEKEERNQKRLVARLSRLWNRTGPR